MSYHAPVHDYKVDVRDPEHPVMRGTAPSFMAKTDELYANLKCVGDIHVLGRYVALSGQASRACARVAFER